VTYRLPRLRSVTSSPTQPVAAGVDWNDACALAVNVMLAVSNRMSASSTIPSCHLRSKRPKVGCWLAAALFLGMGVAHAAEITGIVQEVHDGDSLRLAIANGNIEVRLVDIDAPEIKQPFGKDSRTSLRQMCLLKQATVETRAEDRYGRTLGQVHCGGVNANAEQVRRGMAWVFLRYAPKDSPLFAVETEARLAKRGLWADDSAVRPWEWRRSRDK